MAGFAGARRGIAPVMALVLLFSTSVACLTAAVLVLVLAAGRR